MDVTEFDILLTAVVAQAACSLWCESQQGLQSGRCPRTSAQFKELAEQGQRDDWVATGSVDTEFRVMMLNEVSNGTQDIFPRVQG